MSVLKARVGVREFRGRSDRFQEWIWRSNDPSNKYVKLLAPSLRLNSVIAQNAAHLHR